MKPIIDSHIREDIPELLTFKLNHKVQLSQVERRGRGLEDSRPKS